MKDSLEYPSTQEIIYLLGMGVLLVGTLVFPGLGFVAKEVMNAKRKNEWQQSQKTWNKFNLSLLRYNLKRLQKQKVVKIINQNGEDIIKLTDKGQTKFLKFKLEKLSLKGASWDRKWRLVIYDVSKLKRKQQEQFRRIIKQIKFFQLQKSVYLTPYPCKDEIEYLRQYFNLSQEVLILEISKIENEEEYKKYFGL